MDPKGNVTKRTAFLVEYNKDELLDGDWDRGRPVCGMPWPLKKCEEVTDVELAFEIMRNPKRLALFQGLLQLHYEGIKDHQKFKDVIKKNEEGYAEDYHTEGIGYNEHMDMRWGETIQPELLKYLYTKILKPIDILTDVLKVNHPPDFEGHNVTNYTIWYSDDPNWVLLNLLLRMR